MLLKNKCTYTDGKQTDKKKKDSLNPWYPCLPPLSPYSRPCGDGDGDDGGDGCASSYVAPCHKQKWNLSKNALSYFDTEKKDLHYEKYVLLLLILQKKK